jgi:hypothetical protein
VGKIGKQQGLQYPRSRSLQQRMMRYDSSAAAHSSSSLFQLLAATADYSHADQHSHPQLAALAKSNVELDRGMRVAEDGWRVALARLLQPELTAKSDVLVGVPPPVTTAAGDGDASVVPPWHWA